MERRDIYSGLGELINFMASGNSRPNHIDPREVRARREEAARQQALQQSRERARQQQQSRNRASNDDKNSGGFGYLLATVAGLAAGFLFKSLFSSEEEKSKVENENTTGNNNANYYNNQASNEETGHPSDPELEQCNDLVCPITLEVMNDPVISKKCGHSFEESAIVRWLGSRDYCPKCHAQLNRNDLVKNYSLKNAIEYMRKQGKITKNE